MKETHPCDLLCDLFLGSTIINGKNQKNLVISQSQGCAENEHMQQNLMLINDYISASSTDIFIICEDDNTVER